MHTRQAYDAITNIFILGDSCEMFSQIVYWQKSVLSLSHPGEAGDPIILYISHRPLIASRKSIP